MRAAWPCSALLSTSSTTAIISTRGVLLWSEVWDPALYSTLELVGSSIVHYCMDTGSQVSTVTESFYKRYLHNNVLKNGQYLKLTAVNGLTIPYIGYLELDITVKGNIMKNRGVLVVRDNKNNKHLTEVLIDSMNIINSHLDVLRDVIGTTFSQNNEAQWIQQVNPPPPPPPLSYGFACETRICIPGGSVRAIRVTCSDRCVIDSSSVIIEPLDNPRLSGDVLLLNTVSNIHAYMAVVFMYMQLTYQNMTYMCLPGPG